LRKIVIEGSAEKKKAGEYVIDVTEYSDTPHGNKIICYYQLKHTTVQKDEPFRNLLHWYPKKHQTHF